jgi:CheY-like chemotaxis protein
MSAENDIAEDDTVRANSGSIETRDSSLFAEYVLKGLKKESGGTPVYRLPRRSGGALLTGLRTANSSEHHACRGRVLVIDDQEIVRSILCVMLFALGYETHQASNSAEALANCAKAKESGNPFDAVIIDLNIAGGTGEKELIGRLLEMDPGVKAVVLSGDRHNPALDSFAQCGFAGVLRKPYAVGELRRVMKGAISGHEVSPCDIPSDAPGSGS